ncbi:LpqN/LpqT family lipoprotein [Nocardia sp. BMG51109]|uniref:LpqN/LpqT family lipoprotein n=1 Tax=Nocardia sp. BMG51109 TaxID=1056816 RepID=UPI0004B96987|nr:LpqN/LpqT family lipoprotein [Nocardia sp. BMG51109]
MTSASGPEAPPTVAEYLTAAGVAATPVTPGHAGAPVVAIGVPDGWREMAAENFPGTYAVWAQPPADGWADNAVVLMLRLSRAVDAETLLACGFTDARQLHQWHELDTHMGRFGGHPSAAITGTYVVAALTLWAYNRYTIVDVDGDQYLIQLTVTTRADHDGADADTVVAGLTFGLPAAPRVSMPNTPATPEQN